jgi:endonuclease YncB( thermonuclease family)
MAYALRIAVKPARRCPAAAVPPQCHCSVTIMHVRRLLRPAHGLLAGLMMAGAPAQARADEASPAVTQCRPAPLPGGRVAAVVDGRTFTLEDGRAVRLAAIEVPPLPHAADPGRDGKAGLAAKAALAALIAGREVVLKRLGAAETDRYGRIAAHAFVAGDGAERSVVRELLAQGHAQVAARVPGGCAAGMLAAEKVARTARLGLWADPYYAMKRAEKPAELLAQRGRFAIVEGKVLSVRDSGGIIYVNFGRRWSQDFAVTILKRNERTFATAGLEPNKLTGREIRVRGWIEERGGPRVEAVSPEQIEVVERN